MRFIPMQSSNLAGVSYDQSNEILYAQFANGSVYRYHGVDADAVLSVLFDPDSQGRAFNANIKSGPYPYEKVENIEEIGLHV